MGWRIWARTALIIISVLTLAVCNSWGQLTIPGLTVTKKQADSTLILPTSVRTDSFFGDLRGTFYGNPWTSYLRSDVPDTIAKSIFYDDFERADQTGLGTAPTGQTWVLAGAGYLTAGIVSGRFVSDDNVYAGIYHSQKPTRIGGTFSFTSSASALTIISSSDNSSWLNKMIHLYFDYDNYSLTWWDGADQNNPTMYEVGGSYPELATDGTVYSIYITFSGDAAHIELPNGTVHDVYDTTISRLTGNTAVWQITGTGARWEGVYTNSELTDIIYGGLTVTGGIQGTPIGTVLPSIGNFSSVGIGIDTVSPAGRFHILNNEAYDAGRFESDGAGAVVRIKAKTNGYSPVLLFDEGTTYPAKIYSGGGASDLRVNVWNNDKLIFPAFSSPYWLTDFFIAGTTDSSFFRATAVVSDTMKMKVIVMDSTAYALKLLFIRNDSLFFVVNTDTFRLVKK